MHENSTAALREITASGQKKDRTTAILAVFSREYRQLTDRQVLNILFPGSDNLNLTRPRISELLKAGKLRECKSVRDSVTNKMVRTCEIVEDAAQESMF